MKPYQRKSLHTTVAIEGVGLHSGIYTRLELRPAAAGTGLVFLRSDLGNLLIPALQASTTALDYATSVGKDDVSIGTVEHLLAAVLASGITDLEMVLNGPEVPIIDGSALPFIHLIEAAGIDDLGETIAPLRITSAIEVERNGKRIAIRPAREGLSIRYQIDFDHPVIGVQELSFTLARETFTTELAPARTFGFLRDVAQLRAAGLARGGSVDNCIVLNDEGIENGVLRFDDEFVRHKVLDLIGDLALLGRPLQGEIVASRAGHALHSELLDAIAGNPDCWTIGELDHAPAASVEEMIYV